MTQTGRPRLRRAVLAGAAAFGAVALLAPAADAQAPVRVGWWNTVSAGTLAAPSPATPRGGMHIASAPGQVLAYGAVLYPLATKGSVGRLTLGIASSQGTVQLLACPTRNVTWSGGDDQPAAKAPPYNCATHAVGAVAADGNTVTFTLPTLPAHTLSLAIVPDTSAGDAVFSVDVDKPSPSSLDITTTPSAPPPPPTMTQGSSTAPASKPAPAAGRPLGIPNLPAPSMAQQTVPAGAPAPQVASSTPPASVTAHQSAAATSSGSAALTVGRVVGALAMVAAFMFWGLGRGLLGGRIQALAGPARSSQS